MKTFPFETEQQETVATLEPVLEQHKDETKIPDPQVDDIAAILRGYKEVTPKTTPENTPPTPNPIAGDVYKTGKKAGQPRKPRVTATINPDTNPMSLGGDLLSGAMFLMLINLMIPAIMAGLNNKFSKDKMKAGDLALTTSQENKLAPIADRVLKQLNIQANPTLLLFLSIVGIYGTNFMVAKMLSDKKDDKKEEKKL